MKKQLLIGIVSSVFLFFLSCEKQSTSLEISFSPDTLYIMDEDSIKSIYMATKPGGETEYLITDLPNWLTPETKSGIVNSKIKAVNFIPKKNNLDEGIYSGKISFISEVAGSHKVQVYMTVKGHPKLKINKSVLAFNEGVDNQDIIVENAGTGILNWSIRNPLKWLKFSQTSGYLLKGQKAGIRVSCDRTNLVYDIQTGSFVFNSNTSDSISVNVSMVVPKIATMKLSSKVLVFDYFSKSADVFLKNTGNIS